MEKIFIITNKPTPNNLELFETMGRMLEKEIVVYYKKKSDSGRYLWGQIKGVTIKERYISGSMLNVFLMVKDLVSSRPTFVISAGISSLHSFLAMVICKILNVPVFFWGERYRFKDNTCNRRDSSLIRKILIKYLIKIQWWLSSGVLHIGSLALENFKKNGLPINMPTCNFIYSRTANVTSKGLNTKEYSMRPYDFIFVGRIIKDKGWDVVVNAINLLREKKLKMLIIGDGPDKNNLLLEIRRLKLESLVFYKGFISPDILYKYYSKAKVLLFPTRYDGWGLVVNEALINGLPVIGTYSSGAVKDLIINGKNGFICEPDVASFVCGIEKILRSNRRTMNKEALKTAENHSCEKYVYRLKYFCKSLNIEV